MASSPSKSVSEPAMIEQVITEFFAKSLHIILESRSPYVSSRNYCADLFVPSPSSSSSSSSGQPRDKWFNLALRDCPAALENFDLWRQSNLEPLVVDVILARRRSKEPPLNSWSSGNDEFLPGSKSEKIVERWVVQYESRKSNNVPKESHLSARRSGWGGSSHMLEIPSVYKKTYKRTIVLLRSLYVTVRLLPAYKVFRDLNSSGRICAFSLSHKISSFVEPFTRSEDAEMNQFSFVPVDTPCGRLLLSVSYLPTLEDVSLERLEPATPMSPQFIPDYVGSPNTDPLKRLHSLPSARSLPTYISFTRRHSWSNDLGVEPSVSLSPSPTYSDSRAMHFAASPQLPPQSPPPDQFPPPCPTSHNLWSLAHKKNTSFDEYFPSPPFSPSSSRSPIHCPGVHMRNSLLRSESAPVSIPLPRLGMSSGLASHGLPPSPSSKHAKPGCSSKADLLRAQVSAVSASQTSSPESMLQLRKGSVELHTGMTLQKILYLGKDEVGSLSEPKLSSCSSPRIPSRSSSRLSFLDEFDDSEFACPFAVDDEPTDPCRTESADVDVHAGENLVSGELIPFRRSPDAVVGALVRMLKTAAPLHQDIPNSVISSQVVKEEILNQGIQHNKDVEVGTEKLNTSGSMITASRLYKSRTAVDALEELKSYKEMRELLLRRGGSQPLQVDKAESVDHEDNAYQAENSASEGSLLL